MLYTLITQSTVGKVIGNYTLVLLENGNKTSFHSFYSPTSSFLFSNKCINTKMGKIIC